MSEDKAGGDEAGRDKIEGDIHIEKVREAAVSATGDATYYEQRDQRRYYYGVGESEQPKVDIMIRRLIHGLQKFCSLSTSRCSTARKRGKTAAA